ncbi:hypothetical protein V0288_20550 [Pannus brasiliensis CCIBt3594]|uniref:Uncharacterized protein n=1 Tax=Pannus brasiliensis CCIBt3594 TaxID=1427578 RepID=A0AAW9QP15_9CHRO
MVGWIRAIDRMVVRLGVVVDYASLIHPTGWDGMGWGGTEWVYGFSVGFGYVNGKLVYL